MTTPTADEIDRVAGLLRERDLEIPEFHAMQLHIAEMLLALKDAARDKERLDWLSDNHWYIHREPYPGEGWIIEYDESESATGPTFRAAIDVAMERKP